jgi:hypothetical protein
VGLFRRRQEPSADPVEARVAEYRAERVAASEPAISDLLRELELPYQRKGEAWLVEVGGAWATFGWIPRDATLLGWLDYSERPGPSPILVRANAASGLAWYEAGEDGLSTRVQLPAESVDRTGLTLALGALRREAGGPEESPLESPPATQLEEALAQLPVDPSGIAVVPRGDIAELRLELEAGSTPDDALADWMLQMSGVRGARLGIDEAATLYAIAAIPARPVSPGGLAWAVGEVRALERLYRAA